MLHADRSDHLFVPRQAYEVIVVGVLAGWVKCGCQWGGGAVVVVVVTDFIVDAVVVVVVILSGSDFIANIISVRFHGAIDSHRSRQMMNDMSLIPTYWGQSPPLMTMALVFSIIRKTDVIDLLGIILGENVDEGRVIDWLDEAKVMLKII